MDVLAELERHEQLEQRARWVRRGALAAGITCSLMLAYRVYLSLGLLEAVGALAIFSLLYKLGAGELFLLSAGALCFLYRAAGIWLPLIAAGMWGWLFWVRVQRDRLLRRIDPNRSRSE